MCELTPHLLEPRCSWLFAPWLGLPSIALEEAQGCIPPALGPGVQGACAQPRAHPHLGLDATGERLSPPLRGHLGSRSLSLGLSVPLLLPIGPKGHLPAGRLLLDLMGLPILTTCNDSLIPVSSIPSITNQKGIQGWKGTNTRKDMSSVSVIPPTSKALHVQALGWRWTFWVEKVELEFASIEPTT